MNSLPPDSQRDSISRPRFASHELPWVPCRSMESATKLAERFIAGVTKPARPSTPEAETSPHQYDGPPRTAEQVAA